MKKFLTCTLEDKENNIDYDYIIILDEECLDSSLEELKIKFSKEKVIADDLFHNNDNRFRLINFNVKEQRITFVSFAHLPENLIKKINEILFLFVKGYKERSLFFPAKNFLKNLDNVLEYNLSINLQKEEPYLVRFKDYPFIIGSGKTKKLAVEEAKENLKVYFEYKYDIKFK